MSAAADGDLRHATNRRAAKAAADAALAAEELARLRNLCRRAQRAVTLATRLVRAREPDLLACEAALETAKAACASARARARLLRVPWLFSYEDGLMVRT